MRLRHELLAPAARLASGRVWRRLHQVLLERLQAAGEIDWSRASVDSASVPAKKGGLPPARTRRTGARRGPSATLSPTRVARRSASF